MDKESHAPERVPRGTDSVARNGNGESSRCNYNPVTAGWLVALSLARVATFEPFRTTRLSDRPWTAIESNGSNYRLVVEPCKVDGQRTSENHCGPTRLSSSFKLVVANFLRNVDV